MTVCVKSGCGEAEYRRRLCRDHFLSRAGTAPYFHRTSPVTTLARQPGGGPDPFRGSVPADRKCIDFDTLREDNPDMDASQGITVYAVEHDRRTEVLFTTDALAREYIAARVAAARHYARLSGYEISDTTPAWAIVTYQLWSTVPVVPRSLNTYDDVPGVRND